MRGGVHLVGIVALLASGAAAQRICCMAMTPPCEACKKGMAVKEYCSQNANYPGCERYNANIAVQPPASQLTVEIPQPGGSPPKPAKPTATFDTSMGTFSAELYLDRVPRTASNFIDLARTGFYDGLHFHRVIPAFMAQFGCPYSADPFDRRAGTGGPHDGVFTNLLNGKTEKRFNGGMILDEHTSRDSNTYGTLSMANTGQPNTGGSQFFVNVADNSFLDWCVPLPRPPPLTFCLLVRRMRPSDRGAAHRAPRTHPAPASWRAQRRFTPGSAHPVFGKVISGMDVVEAITLVHTRSDTPETPIKMNRVTVSNAPAAPQVGQKASTVTTVPGRRGGPMGGIRPVG